MSERAGRLSGMAVAVAGSTQGIGADIAKRLAAEGALVAVSGRNREKGEKVAQAYPGRMAFIPCDVTKKEDCDALVDETVRIFGRIDALVYNTGIFPRFPVTDTPEDVFDRVFATNFGGAYFTCAAAVRAFRAQGTGGTIVNVGTTHWKHGSGVYPVSKGALHTLTHNLAHAYADEKIRCCWITVGWVLSEGEIEMNAAEGYTDKTYEDAVRANYPPGGRMQTGDDIASAAVYLLSDEASQVTACDIEVHGAFRFVSETEA